uniref:Sodium-coupled monocarboxylate transporter 2 n=4 Tax=Lygus hesperus TaxID=30085 RepID=A0A0K8TCQ9_LYGHE
MIGVTSAWVYLPVTYSIKSASSFEFFDRRFNQHIRKFASLIFVVETILHTAMSQYVPALTLSQATGWPVFPLACVLSLICFAYTASGGLKAVAWADSFQALVFMTTAFAITITGTLIVGGPTEVWHRGVEGSRLELFNFDSFLTKRYNTPNLIVGGICMLSHNYLSPSFHQRVASMPTLGTARQVVIWSSIFAGIFMSATFLAGIMIYAYFAGCDPVLAKKGIESHSTILPYFVKQISNVLPGIEGLFLSGVVAAGLSTTTSCWNTVACTIYEDFFVPAMREKVQKKTALRILTGIVLFISLLSTSFILVIQNVSSIQEATLSVKSFTLSMLFILNNAGMFLPWVNSKGVLAGSLVSGTFTTYVVLGTLNAKKKKLVRDLPKILTTAMCLVNGTSTMESLNMTTSIGTTGYGLVTESDPSVPQLFKMSFMLYTLPGTVLGLVVALMASLLTGPQNLATVDREMIVPLMHWVLPRPKEERRADTPLDEYVKVSQTAEED